MTFTFEHPLRNIQWEYDPAKQQTKPEATGIATYKNLHDRLWTIRQGWMYCHERVDKLSDLFSRIKEEYKTLEKETKQYGTIAGYTVEEIKTFGLPEGEYTLDVYNLSTIIQSVTDLVNNYNKETVELDAFFKAVEEKLEQFDAAFDRFLESDFKMIVHNYDEVQLDTTSFDKEVDAFRKMYGEVYSLRDSYVDKWNEISEERKLYDQQVEELNKHVKSVTDSAERIINLGGEINPN